MVDKENGRGNGYAWALVVLVLLAAGVVYLLVPRPTVVFPVGPRWIGKDMLAGILILCAVAVFAGLVMHWWQGRDERKLARLRDERLRAEGNHPKQKLEKEKQKLEGQAAGLDQQAAGLEQTAALRRRLDAGSSRCRNKSEKKNAFGKNASKRRPRLSHPGSLRALREVARWPGAELDAQRRPWRPELFDACVGTAGIGPGPRSRCGRRGA